MDNAAWLRIATEALQSSGIDSARLDSLLLLEDATGHDRGWLLAHPEQELSDEQLAGLANNLERRLQHEPLAYIRGTVEFYGRQFNVTPDVLVPRPESEAIIELLLEHVPGSARIADIGSGSGCLAITALLETNAVACAVDIDEACLAATQHNAVSLGAPAARLRTVHGSLLEPFLAGGAAADFQPDVLLANLPYVPAGYPINPAARHEPTLALFAGPDGLDLYRTMFEQLPRMAALPQLLLTESLLSQHADLAKLAATAGYRLLAAQGLAQAFAHSSS